MSQRTTDAPPLRLAVVNDYEIVVAGVRAMLAGHGRVELVALDPGPLRDGSVDVVLYDTFGQQWDDASHLRDLVTSSRARVVVFTWGFEPAAITRALDAGAAGYLSKGLPADELVAALLEVRSGAVVVGREQPRPSGPERPGPWGWPGQAHGITSREAEILALITQGLTNPQIASAMFLSINSIKTYIRTLYRKIGATRRSQAVRYGMEHGFEPHRTGSIS